jgi:hypothetical protein
MRAILTCLILVLSAPTAVAQSARISGIDVVGFGLMNPEKLVIKKDESISTGQILTAKATLSKSTSTIPAKLGTSFGIVADINGEQDGRETVVTVVWIYPEPGIKNPEGGAAKRRDQYDDQRRIGETGAKFYWALNAEYVLVPGKWTVELWQSDRKLASKTFTLIKQ